MKNFLFYSIMALFLSACIGNDIEEDYVEPEFRVDEGTTNKIPEELSISETYQFNVDFINDIGAKIDLPITWQSSDEEVITIDTDGIIEAVGIGTAKISASVENDNPTSEDEVITKELATIIVNPIDEVLAILNTKDWIALGENFTFLTEYKNNLGKVDNEVVLDWFSSNENVATISDKGELTPVSIGETTITVKNADETVELSLELEVRDVSSVIRIDNEISQIFVGGTHQLSAVFFDKSSMINTVNNITWSSDNSSVISVDATGLITANTLGSSIIKAETNEDGNVIEKTITVEVLNNTIAISNPLGNAINIDDTYDYNVNFIGTSEVVWSSSDSSVASINSSTGVITALGKGSTTITVSTTESGVLLQDTSILEVKGELSKTAILSGSAYDLEGSVEFTSTALTFSKDFNVGEAPGGYFYLSNNARSISSAVRVGEQVLPKKGTWFIALNNVNINDYKYIVFWCDAFPSYLGGGEFTENN